jgi:hypothetical protein
MATLPLLRLPLPLEAQGWEVRYGGMWFAGVIQEYIVLAPNSHSFLFYTKTNYLQDWKGRFIFGLFLWRCPGNEYAT